MERVKCSRVSILCSECGVQGGWGWSVCITATNYGVGIGGMWVAE